MATYVMSIKNEYGLNLLKKKSLWEYRRRRSKIAEGDKIILYATFPHSRFIGEFIIGEILNGRPDEIWEKTKHEICYQKNEVVPYLESGDFPIAFKVTNPKEYLQAVPINKTPFFKPPVSYCKASEELISLLESL